MLNEAPTTVVNSRVVHLSGGKKSSSARFAFLKDFFFFFFFYLSTFSWFFSWNEWFSIIFWHLVTFSQRLRLLITSTHMRTFSFFHKNRGLFPFAPTYFLFIIFMCFIAETATLTAFNHLLLIGHYSLGPIS